MYKGRKKLRDIDIQWMKIQAVHHVDRTHPSVTKRALSSESF